jgi:hypothetical protein
MPLSQCPRLGLHEQIHVKTGIGLANLGAGSVKDHPEPASFLRHTREVELDYHPAREQSIPFEIPVHPGMEDHARVEVFGGEFDPALTPLSQRRHYLGQVVARGG